MYLDSPLARAAGSSPIDSTFVEVATDVADVLGWSLHGGQPPRTVLRDRRTQRQFTVIQLGCRTLVAPHVILLGDRDGVFTMFGPCEVAHASGLARWLAHRHGRSCWTMSTPLHPAVTATVRADAWQRVPPALIAGISVTTPGVSTPDRAVLLLDRRRSVIAALGPFAHDPDSLPVHEDGELAFDVEQIPIALHPIAETNPAATRRPQ
jgi:hypothetical protein